MRTGAPAVTLFLRMPKVGSRRTIGPSFCRASCSPLADPAWGARGRGGRCCERKRRIDSVLDLVITFQTGEYRSETEVM
jgi:hypothetical protein